MNAEETTRQYDEILELTLQQREAIGSGDLEGLLTLLGRRETLLTSLAAAQPGAGSPAWRRRIAELDRAHETVLTAWCEQTADELASIRRGRAGLGAYRASAPVEDAFIDRIS